MAKKKKNDGKLDLSDEPKDPLVEMDEEDDDDGDEDIDLKKLKVSGLHIEGEGDELGELDEDVFTDDDEEGFPEDEFGDEKDQW